MNFFKKVLYPVWEAITKNWQAKVVSLLVAAALWWFVYTQTNTERSFYIPIQYYNLSPQLTIVKTNDVMARVYIQGKKDRIASFETHQIRVFVDLSEAIVGWNTNEIQIALREMDPSLAVTLEKTTTTLLIDMVQIMTVPIVPKLVDSVATGYEVETIELRPASTVVIGPTSKLSNLQYLESESISLKGLDKTLRTNVTLFLPEGIELLHNETYQLTIHIRSLLSNTNLTE